MSNILDSQFLIMAKLNGDLDLYTFFVILMYE